MSNKSDRLDKEDTMGKYMKKLSFCWVVLVLFFTSCNGRRFPQVAYERAYEALITEDYVVAAKQFKRLATRYSVYPEIWYQYGLCCMETGEYKTAIEAFNKTAGLYENSVLYDDKTGLCRDALVTIGEVYLLQCDFDKAEGQFEKCFSFKNDRDMVIAVAATYIRLGFVAECEEYFAEKGIDLAEL